MLGLPRTSSWARLSPRLWRSESGRAASMSCYENFRGRIQHSMSRIIACVALKVPPIEPEPKPDPEPEPGSDPDVRPGFDPLPEPMPM